MIILTPLGLTVEIAKSH